MHPTAPSPVGRRCRVRHRSKRGGPARSDGPEILSRRLAAGTFYVTALVADESVDRRALVSLLQLRDRRQRSSTIGRRSSPTRSPPAARARDPASKTATTMSDRSS